MSAFAIEKLRGDHDRSPFDCGKDEPNRFLRRFALANQQAQSATYVACQGITVVGYYSLAFGSVAHEQTPERVKKGLARHPIPVMVFGAPCTRSALSRQRSWAGIA